MNTKPINKDLALTLHSDEMLRKLIKKYFVIIRYLDECYSSRPRKIHRISYFDEYSNSRYLFFIVNLNRQEINELSVSI